MSLRFAVVKDVCIVRRALVATSAASMPKLLVLKMIYITPYISLRKRFNRRDKQCERDWQHRSNVQRSVQRSLLKGNLLFLHSNQTRPNVTPLAIKRSSCRLSLHV